MQVSDSAFYDEIYTSSASRRDKDPTFAHSFNVTTGDEAAFWTAPHALHLLRRSALNPYFSKRKIADAQDVVKLQVVRLCERLQALAGAGDVVNLSDAFFATMTESVWP